MRKVLIALILAISAGGLTQAVPAVADDASATTSATDNYASLSGSSSAKQGFQSSSQTNYLGSYNDFTVEAWVKPADTVTSTTADIFVKTDRVQYEITNGVYTALYNNSAGAWKALISTGVSAKLNEWQHVAFVKSGNIFTFYLNGKQAFTVTDATNVPTALNNTTTYTSVGSNPWNGSSNTSTPGGNFFSGGIDEVRVWSTVRTQSEIETNMNVKVASSATGIVSIWDFNGTTTSGSPTIYDRKGTINLTANGVTFPTFPDVKTSTTSGDVTTVTFPRSYLNGTGGFPVPTGITSVTYLVVAGGGGGAGGQASEHGGGGGGAGGVLTGTLSVSAGPINVTVGSGGLGGVANGVGTSGINSSLAGSVTTIGGGAGGSYFTVAPSAGPATGGSGGGAGASATTSYLTGANGTSGQGNKGGNVTSTGTNGVHGGGGGGAGGVGGNTVTTSTLTVSAGAGGVGVASSISGSWLYYGGGGGGGGNSSRGGTGGASGGSGGGGNGASWDGTTTILATNGSANTGGGGGGGIGTGGATATVGGAGGSGIIILQYAVLKASATISFSSAPTYRSATTITATTTLAGKVTFFANNKKIAGCIKVATSGSGPITATCSWKPAFHGNIVITTQLIPTDTTYSSGTSSANPVLATKRSNSR